jgi:hypothetical protein
MARKGTLTNNEKTPSFLSAARGFRVKQQRNISTVRIKKRSRSNTYGLVNVLNLHKVHKTIMTVQAT